MGNIAANRYRPPMKIHKLHGKNLRVSGDRLMATRFEGYADAMFFGSRTVDRDEVMELTITEMTQNWNGSLRFGFTSHDPVAIVNHPEGIPRFMCPDLVKRGGSFIETLNHIKLRVGDRIMFWVSVQGEVHVKVNDVQQRSQTTKLVTRDVWPVVDVYGNAVEVKFRSQNDRAVAAGQDPQPHIYTSLSLSKFPIAANTDSLDFINREFIRRKLFVKTYAWNANPLPVNSIWLLFVKEVDYEVSRNLSITVMMNAPGSIGSLPEAIEGFPRGTFYRDVYRRMIVGDELAICITDNGSVMEWIDYRLRWQPSSFGGVDTVSLSSKNLWRPDVGVMNGKASEDFDFSNVPQSRVNVKSSGGIIWLHGAILHVTCPLDVRYFPFDKQICYLILTPWQSSIEQLQIEPIQRGSAVDNSYLPNSNVSEWEIVDINFSKKFYRSQLQESYQFISISISLKRQPLYFIVLVLVPFSMLSGLACLIFTLSDTGDRLTVALSLVLSMTMYVVIVSTNAPRSMRTLPVLGIYLLDQLGLLSIATVLAVVNNKLRDKIRYNEMIAANDNGLYRDPMNPKCFDRCNESPIKSLRKQSLITCNYSSRQRSIYTVPNIGIQKSNNAASYMKLADNMDHIELTIYLILSVVNAIVCLLILPSMSQKP